MGKKLIGSIGLSSIVLKKIIQVSQKICYDPGNSTLLFYSLVLFFRVSGRTRNKCSKDSFIQIHIKAKQSFFR